MELLNEICLFGEGHCFNTRSPAASSVYCYALALAYTVSVSIQRSRLGEHGHATHLLPVKRMRWLPTFLILSYLTRITWLLLSEMHAFEWVNDQTYTHMILPVPFLPTSMDIYVLGVSSFNKLATLFYFSAFTLLLRFWDDVLYLAKRSDKPLARMAANQSVLAEYTRPHAHPRSRTLFVVANVWIYLVEGVLLVLKTLFPHQELFLFQADYSFVALFFFALSLMLARSAYKLRQVLLRIEFSSLAASIAWRVTWLGTILSIVFLGRSVLLLIATPAIEVFDPHRSNPWLFYTIPEIVPGWVVICMMTVKKPSKQPTHRRNRMDETTPLLPIPPLERHTSDETISPFEGLELRI